MANQLIPETLQSWLWQSANVLRGFIDSSDFKNYNLGLLFLKRFFCAKISVASHTAINKFQGNRAC
ncbi:type I restriction-modification system subunit M N-terminal domain-containing protein [Paraburkholderia phosphatilytica]|uniref:type I restriction-modification system subunit M N-terminal domain-containing protein n=1 Tax=Paraburkholderia phosphatilytica TaxID=2282883 RepID=UPI001F0BEDF5|nr:type I restriction-modification system subunit M N-terminal domain-containing protein [Paraburkholderia phosphatilytica]